MHSVLLAVVDWSPQSLLFGRVCGVIQAALNTVIKIALTLVLLTSAVLAPLYLATFILKTDCRVLKFCFAR